MFRKIQETSFFVLLYNMCNSKLNSVDDRMITDDELERICMDVVAASSRHNISTLP